MTQLRQRMVGDMNLRNFAETTNCAPQKVVHGEFIIMRRWASGTTLDNASAGGRNAKLGCRRSANIRFW